MPEFLKLMPPDQALNTFLSELPTPSPKLRRMKTIDARGHILMEDVIANEPLPSFSRSTVDGYAVIASDTFGASDSLPVYLPSIGEVPMGGTPQFTIRPGTICTIHTGGMLPQGANAVIMLENTQVSRENEIELYKAVAAGENIIEAGEDVRPGETVLFSGVRLRSAEIGGLLALGITEIMVAESPRVAIISSGDEVIPPGQIPLPGQVRDINSYTLRSLIKKYGGEPIVFGIVPDDKNIFQEKILQAFQESDMVIVTAGSSASARDYTSTVIKELGTPGVLVHGVSIRPGKPTILAVCNGKPVIGLPGNPVSALVIANIFAIPALEHIMGCKTERIISTIKATLTINVPSVAGREDYMPVHLKKTSLGFRAEPIFYKSNMIFTLAQSDGLLYIPPDAVGLAGGEVVDILLIG